MTLFWYALRPTARDQLDEYLLRYLNFLSRDDARKRAPTVTSADALRDAAKMAEDLGCDELLLVPTTSDPDDIDRVAEILC